MKSIIRKDEAAVSPVIATILMVAITVVLAAVLYVMVSGLITGPGGTPQAMGVSVQPSSDRKSVVEGKSVALTGVRSTSKNRANYQGGRRVKLSIFEFASRGPASRARLPYGSTT